MKRLLYLGHYLKQLDYSLYRKQLNFAAQITGRSKKSLNSDVLTSVFKYNISLLEYFQFRFFEQRPDQRSTWAGTGYMYEYQKLMNPPTTRSVLEHKPHFYHRYSQFINHQTATFLELETDHHKADALLDNPSGKIVLKKSTGQCGRGLEVWNTQMLTPTELIQRLIESENDLAEEFVVQHNRLRELSNSGLNTVRIITQLDNRDDVHILGARLRISVNSPVDNLAAGNIAAPIDLETGVITGPAVYSDITKDDITSHPVTGVEIIGFEIPYWNEALAMCKKAAFINTRNRSIGWDVAITDTGAELIEGNHDWCKLLWQLPVKRGLKHRLEPYRKMSTQE